MQRTLLGLFVMIGAMSASATALAQDFDSALQGLDQQFDTLERVGPSRGISTSPLLSEDSGASTDKESDVVVTGMRDTPKPFKLTFAVPLIHDSNAFDAERGEQDAWKAAPILELAASRPFKNGALAGVSVGAGHDSWTEVSATKDQAIWFAKVYGSVPLGDLTAYGEYRPTEILTKLWDEHKLTTHDVTLGIKGTVGEMLGGTVKFDGALVSRQTDVATADRDVVRGRLEYKREFESGPFSTITISQTLELRDFGATASAGREDTNSKTVFSLGGLMIGGDFITVGGAQLRIDLTFEVNDSNKPLKSYESFDIGPVLAYQVEF